MNKGFTELICNNEWVLDLLEERRYHLGRPKFDFAFPDQVLPRDCMVYDNGSYVSATVVRDAIVRGKNWEKYLVPEIADYIKGKNLVGRVKRICGRL